MLSYEQKISTPSLPAWFTNLPYLVQAPVGLFALSITLLFALIGYFLATSAWRIVKARVLRNDGYDHIPRPQHTSKWWPILGDLPQIREAPPAEAHIAWSRELDSEVYIYRAIFYLPRLILGDTKAMNYILGQQNSYNFPKPEQTRQFLDNLLGNGLLVAEGDIHRRQRKVIQPAFNVSAMRALTPLFFRHSNEFVAKLAQLVDETTGPSEQPVIEGQSVQSAQKSQAKKPVFDISHWFGRLTLDIIGDAGFDHTFDAVKLPIDEQHDSLVASFRSLMRMISSVSISEILLVSLGRIKGFAWTVNIPTARRRVIFNSRVALDQTGKSIIETKRREIQAEMQEAKNSDGTYNEKAFFDEQEESKGKAKDLLYLMMKANMAPGVRDSERMSDAELLGQITTLLTAGHETTSTLLTWFIHMTTLPENKHVITKLRAEIEEHFAGRDELDYDALMAMPYLDNCTKEVLRLVSPVVNTERTALRDDVIPLSKSYKTKDGKSTFNSIVVKKDQLIFIPIQLINRSKNIWGPTADEFEPDRWDEIPKMAKETGFPSHILSFIEGPRGCIGNRFAIAEFKAIICTFLRSFDYDSAGWEIERKQGIVVRPRVVGQEELGTQLPIRLQKV